ncbi:VOC family protein [archaeon]|nr:MAG: VOC family protein [archaeon]
MACASSTTCLVISLTNSPTSCALCAVSQATTAERDVPEAAVRDPHGVNLYALHCFRRNPIISITLLCRNMDASAALYANTLGMREVRADELHELHLPKRLLAAPATDARFLTFGEPYNTPSIVLQQASECSKWHEEDSVLAPVLSFHVPDIAFAHAHVTAAGLDATDVEFAPVPFSGSSERLPSFSCYDPDGHVLHISGLSSAAAPAAASA